MADTEKKPVANQDDALFAILAKKKRRKRRKAFFTVVAVLAVAAVGVAVAVNLLQKRVNSQMTSAAEEVLSYTVAAGSISTTVSGSGTLSDPNTEAITVPDNVEITDVLVERGDLVSAGDVLATVNLSSVTSAMRTLQEELDALDDEINSASSETVGTSIASSMKGRVKAVYGQKDMDVAACMAEHGALAVLSLDGYLALELDSGSLNAGDAVEVVCSNEKTYSGTVDQVEDGVATILVTDNGPLAEDVVTVLDGEGNTLGQSTLYIHKPLKITGYAGTISYVSVQENQQVYANSSLFSLKNTSYSVNYDSLLASRTELEEQLMELVTLYQQGAVLAEADGKIASVDYNKNSAPTAVATVSANDEMEIAIYIDESDILALELEQSAVVTISSIGDETYTGTVTSIDKTPVSSSGITVYTATITIPRTEQMLAGMSASVDIVIQGVENTLIIPVDALHRTSTSAYVYTSYDAETGTYGGMMEVSFGLMGSDYVEISNGLSAGDVVYYTKSSSTNSFNPSVMFVNMGGGMNMPGGNMGGMSSGGMGGFPGGNTGGFPRGG